LLVLLSKAKDARLSPQRAPETVRHAARADAFSLSATDTGVVSDQVEGCASGHRSADSP